MRVYRNGRENELKIYKEYADGRCIEMEGKLIRIFTDGRKKMS